MFTRNTFLVYLLFCVSGIGTLSGCTKQKIKRINTLIQKEKYDKAQKKSDKLLRKRSNGKWTTPVRMIYQKSLYYSVSTEGSLPRLYAFAKNYPSSEYYPKVQQQIYTLLLSNDTPSEEVFLSYFQTAPNHTYASMFYDEAEKLAFASAQQKESAQEYHNFLLRYPEGKLQNQAIEKESNLAFHEAVEQNNVPTWSEFIIKYPSHPKINEARSNLRRVEWLALSKQSTPKDLWAYADKFSETEEGWISAVSAFRQLRWLVSVDGTTYHEYESDILQNMHSFETDFQGTLPIGYQTELYTKVYVDQKWINWSEAYKIWGTQLKVNLHDEEDVITLDPYFNKHVWKTTLPICSLSVEPLPIQLCSKLTFKEKEQEFCKEVKVTSQCNGAQQMIFSSFEDDIVGPIGGIKYNSNTKKWEAITVGVGIPEDWTCTHIYEHTEDGVNVVCGEFLMQIGWMEDSFAIQKSPDNLHQIDRVSLEPWVNDSNKPFEVKNNHILNDTQQVVYEAGERSIKVSPAIPMKAFQSRQQLKPFKEATEELHGNNIIRPKDSQETMMKDVRAEDVATVSQNLEEYLKLNVTFRFVKSVQVGQNEFMPVFLVISDSTQLLMIYDETTKWLHFMQLPMDNIRSVKQFYSFEYKGIHYLRMFGLDEQGLVHLFSITKAGKTFTLDQSTFTE